MTTAEAVGEMMQKAFEYFNRSAAGCVPYLADCQPYILRPKNMKETVKLTLPYPPTVNLMYATFRGRRVLSRAGRNYKRDVQAIVMLNRAVMLWEGELSLSITVYRPRKSGDLDNTLKAVQDSLTGLVWKDDRQIVEIHAHRRDDKDDPRAEVEITEL